MTKETTDAAQIWNMMTRAQRARLLGFANPSGFRQDETDIGKNWRFLPSQVRRNIISFFRSN